MLAGGIVVKTRTMWLVLFLLLTTLIVLCDGNKDTSCDFQSSSRWCHWYLDERHNCQWERIDRSGGYLYLKGENRCSSRFTRKFGWYDGDATDYLTIEYYVTGPGPFSLSVSNEKRSRRDWTCSIQPGKKRRLAHVSVGGDAYYIYITGKVAKGSGIIITQIWNSLRGKKVQHVCPAISHNMDNMSTITRPTMTTTTLTSSKPTTKTIKTITPIRFTTTAIPTRSTIPTTIMQIKNITATTSSQKSTRLKISKWNSTINISKSSAQKTTATIVKSYYQTTETVLPSKAQATLLPVRNITTESGNNPESMTRNINIGKTDIEIEKEKTKKMIIGSVLGAVVFTILMIFLTIMVIIKKQRKQMNNLPFIINVIVVGNQSASERNGNLAQEILLPCQS